MKVESHEVADSHLLRAPSPNGAQAGDYFHSPCELYRVEHCDGERALIEDCRTGVLIDIELRRLLELERVPR